MLTWSQLGLHRKPCGLLNVDGYYDPLLALLNHAVTEGFLRAEHRSLLLEEREPGMLLQRLHTWKAPVLRKWIERDET